MNRGGKEREKKGILTAVSGTITDIIESSSPPNKARKMMSIVINPKRYVKYRGNTLLLIKKQCLLIERLRVLQKGHAQ